MTKKEERAANQQKAEELRNDRKTQPVSGDTAVDFPLTSPAAKQQADRLEQDKSGAFAKPYPQGSNLTSTGVSAEPAPQTDAEFKETGGQKITDTTSSAPTTSGGSDDTSTTNVADKTTGSEENNTEGENA